MMLKNYSFDLSRRLGLAVILLSSTPAFAEEQVNFTPQARQLFKEGSQALGEQTEQGDREAFDLFEQAYEDSPYWKILGNLGIAAQKLERYGDAIKAYEEYLQLGKNVLGADELEQVTRDLDELNFDSVGVSLNISGGSSEELWIVDTRRTNDKPVMVNRYGPFDSDSVSLVLHSGYHQLSAERAGFAPEIWDVNLRPGSSQVHSYQLEPQQALGTDEFELTETPSSQLLEPVTRAGGWTYGLWVSSAVLAGLSGAFYVKQQSVKTDSEQWFSSYCPEGAGSPGCPATTAGDRNAAAWGTGSWLAAGGAAATLAVGTYLYFDAPVAGTEVSAVRVHLKPSGFAVSGRF